MSMLQIATSWFERRRIGDDITLLREPHVHPLLRCNIWHVRGRDRDLLVDTGLGVASLKDAARDLFEKPVTAVLTHTHMDHAGGAHEFGELCVHADEVVSLHEASNHLPLDVGAWDAASLGWMASMGYDISQGLMAARPCAGFEIATHHMRRATATRTLNEGDIVGTGDRAFEVLHLPGHSPGSIGLWEKATGTLFAGDAIYDGPLLDEIPGADVATYIATMKRLRELPVTIVHAGHDPSFDRARLIEIADAYLKRRG